MMISNSLPPNAQICTASLLISIGPPTAHIGGLARGYQELPAQSSTPATAERETGSSYVYASSALVVNARTGRIQRGRLSVTCPPPPTLDRPDLAWPMVAGGRFV